ncbi:hypothetical protein DT73_08850 [Mangrovibacter sp. MFB070]|nr:hypothetical protein DT73_08850 [Mangrovibacter sp. MFB070]
MLRTAFSSGQSACGRLDSASLPRFALFRRPGGITLSSFLRFTGLTRAGLAVSGGFFVLYGVAVGFVPGGFVFQAASGSIVDSGRRSSLEEIYDYLPGLKNEPRYNSKTGLPKKIPRRLIPEDLRAYKTVTKGRACYVIL